ncbi:MAG TPA: response regulator [Bryobacteraceae bacterium]|nr:response regulator [Bryobacteraceae bacterium]
MAKLVVIVDDTDSVASCLALAFEGIPDVKTVIAHTSGEALRLFRAPDSCFAAVVTDLHLPTLNGFELIREIRSLPPYRNLPAIMITADEQARLRPGPALDGPNVLFRKPCSVKEVSRVLEELLT